MKRGYAPKQRYMVRFICVFRREALKLLCETALSIASDDVGLKRETCCLPVLWLKISAERRYGKGPRLKAPTLYRIDGYRCVWMTT